MAERPWHNCSRTAITDKRIAQAGIHGRKAVAQLQLAGRLAFTLPKQVSMAERPWHNCSVVGAIDAE